MTMEMAGKTDNMFHIVCLQQQFISIVVLNHSIHPFFPKLFLVICAIKVCPQNGIKFCHSPEAEGLGNLLSRFSSFIFDKPVSTYKAAVSLYPNQESLYDCKKNTHIWIQKTRTEVEYNNGSVDNL